LRRKPDVIFSLQRILCRIGGIRASAGWPRPGSWGPLLLAFLICGCAERPRNASAFSRPFIFQEDSFSYENGLTWVYHVDPVSGKMKHRRREPPPAYARHCFVMARSARQFHQHARFEPGRPQADEQTYRRAIRDVVSRSLRHEGHEGEKIVIPGYANLFAFSQAQERLLKEECGGAWQSYFQRGHWRMVFPFSRRHQEKMAVQLSAALRRNRPPIVHVVRFPSQTINHAMVLFDARETEDEIEFAAYDPNSAGEPARLVYARHERTFHFARNAYFKGGRVDVYEVYHRLNY